MREPVSGEGGLGLPETVQIRNGLRQAGAKHIDGVREKNSDQQIEREFEGRQTQSRHSSSSQVETAG